MVRFAALRCVCYLSQDMVFDRRHFESSAELRDTIRQEFGGSAILAFSLGKDAIASWIALLESGFTQIVPYYMWLVPGLSFVDEAIGYFESKFGCPILQVPHPSVFRMLKNRVFQPPGRSDALWRAQKRFKRCDFADVGDRIRRMTGVNSYTALGTRAVDSPIRLMSVRKHGAVNHGIKTYMPVYDWRLADVVNSIRRHNVKLPIDYRLFGRSFDGLDWRFLKPIRDHFPQDYQTILEWFPLAELELLRKD